MILILASNTAGNKIIHVKEEICLQVQQRAQFLQVHIKCNHFFLQTKKIYQKITSEVLYRLGVENIKIIDLGGYLSKDAYNELKQIGRVTIIFDNYKEIYDNDKI